MGKKLKAVQTASAIADSLGVHKSTVSRRLKSMGRSERTRIGKPRNGTQGVSSGDRAAIKSRLRKYKRS